MYMLVILWIVFVTLVLILLVLIVTNTSQRRKLLHRCTQWDNYNNSYIVNNSLIRFNGKYNIYRTKDGKAYFVFRYIPTGYYNSRYEIDILSQPSYAFRQDNCAVTHRLPSERNGCKYKICIMYGYEPRSEEQAKKFSADWAELTWKYIKTGITIDKQLTRR